MGLMWPEREVKDLPAFSTKVKYCSYVSKPYIFMEWYLIKYVDKFTFTPYL